MLSFPASLRVFIVLDPCDMRAGINTLHALVADRLKADVRGGALFVFTNSRPWLIKVLHWDGTGMWLMTAAEKGHVRLHESVESGIPSGVAAHINGTSTRGPSDHPVRYASARHGDAVPAGNLRERHSTRMSTGQVRLGARQSAAPPESKSANSSGGKISGRLENKERGNGRK